MVSLDHRALKVHLVTLDQLDH
jgi:hypothetical protein